VDIFLVRPIVRCFGAGLRIVVETYEWTVFRGNDWRVFGAELI
jgi:hypothetical protein